MKAGLRWALPMLGVLATSAAAAPPGGPDVAAANGGGWAAMAALPDWSGVWLPDWSDEDRRIQSDPTPWTPKAARRVAEQIEAQKAGKPAALFVNCLPYGLPALMTISHNAMEFVFERGRVLVLGESDGSRLRRIYTDGRSHSADPDPTFFGESVGRWEGATLVVDTIGILPEAYVALSEAVGVPNNGAMHVQERIHLKDGRADVLDDDMTITAPGVLTRPWKTSRIFHRDPTPRAAIVEGSCLQGSYTEGKDPEGFSVFVPRRSDALGFPVPQDRRSLK